MIARRALYLVAGGLALLGAAVALLLWPRQAPPPLEFVGTQACASCHSAAFENWQQSHHRHAMEAPTADSVLGDFNDATFEHFGTTSRFFTRDGQYFVETDNASGELQTFPVAYTFGWYPLQQYLIAFPDGRLQALSISWDSRPAAEGGQRWYHLYPDEQIAHDDPLHWTGSFQNWNSRCATCHSTELVKGYSRQDNSYTTHWKELNVGCEACHGPGSRHLAWADGEHSLENRGLATRVGALWQPTTDARPAAQAVLGAAGVSGQVQVCGGCHSRRGELVQPDITADFFDNFSLSPVVDGLYFADGQIRDEVYEAGSFLQSRMHQNHVSCTNCHEPHSSQLRVTGNGLCLQCHQAPKFQTREHFFHVPDSAGAQCVNCHMPERTYMGVDARRDHSFRVPDPIASLRFGVPNACTQCHTDRDDAWAAAFITQQTGRSEPWYPHASLLHTARGHDPAASAGLLAYAADQANPPILRGIMLQESTRFPSREQVEAATRALSSTDPQVRTGAIAALAVLDPTQRLARLQPLLQDPLRSVRLAAARQLADLPLARAPAAVQPLLESAFNEYRQALQHNADLPESMSELGVFLASQGDLDGAEQALQHARRIAPGFLPAMLNLADIHRARNRDDLGEPLLREAMEAYPESGDVLHMLGLLHVRTGRTPDSVALFRQAAELAPENPQYALVHAVSLVETGRRAQGLAVLEAATARFPGNASLRQALEGYRSAQP
jgi:predicted CXXCH cytochrome family protein